MTSSGFVALVVEDDALTRFDVAGAFKASGWAVLEAASGELALKLCNSDTPVDALITDIGNDIMYGAPPQQIEAWMDECINRLQTHNANIAMTMLPIHGLRKVAAHDHLLLAASKAEQMLDMELLADAA